MTSQVDLDQGNSEFWNELCGSRHAKMLGISDRSAASLEKFDAWFFGYYPWLARHIPFETLKGKDVLEIGLGYGSVSQRIAMSGARYHGLDIAAGPVEMVNYRMRIAGLSGEAVLGNALSPPFASESMDIVVSIGCFHHTGDIARSIREAHRILRSGGSLIMMVYNALSYRRWLEQPSATFEYLMSDLLGEDRRFAPSAAEKARYDANIAGKPAPHIDWISIAHLKRFCSQFSSFEAKLENISPEPRIAKPNQIQRLTVARLKRSGADVFAMSREALLKTAVPAIEGLDIYATAIK